jgi:hypothetical protein
MVTNSINHSLPDLLAWLVRVKKFFLMTQKVISAWLSDRWWSSRTCVPDWSSDEQWKSGHIQFWHTEITAAAAGHQGADHVSCMSRPSQEHDLPLWSWYMPDVWGPHVWVPHLSQAGWETHSSVLNFSYTWGVLVCRCHFSSDRQAGSVPKLRCIHDASIFWPFQNNA